MQSGRLRSLCLSLPGATEQIQWGDDLVFKVSGKMFFCTGLEPESPFSFKCEEAAFYDLTERAGIRPAPYLARAHWIQIDPAACDLDPSELEALVRRSYALVVARLSKKARAALQSEKTADQS